MDIKLSEYITEQTAQGVGLDVIKRQLIASGWTEQQLDQQLAPQPSAGKLWDPVGGYFDYEPNQNNLPSWLKLLVKIFPTSRSFTSNLLRFLVLPTFLLGIVGLLGYLMPDDYWHVVLSSLGYLFLTVAILSLYISFVFGERYSQLLSGYQLAKDEGWKYIPYPGIGISSKVSKNFFYIYDLGIPSKSVRDLFWGVTTTSPFMYSSIVWSTAGSRSHQGKTHYASTYAFPFQSDLGIHITIVPNSLGIAADRRLIQQKLQLESLDFNHVFTVFYEGDLGMQGGKIYSFLNPLMQEELVNLSKSLVDCIITIKGNVLMLRVRGSLLKTQDNDQYSEHGKNHIKDRIEAIRNQLNKILSYAN